MTRQRKKHRPDEIVAKLRNADAMLNAGKADVKILADGWTTVTRDQSLSAQFEHSVGVTETGVEIFTPSPKGIEWRQAA